MYTAEIRFALPGGVANGEITGAVKSLLGALYRNGQTLSREYPLALDGTELTAYLAIPERDSLDAPRHNSYVAKGLGALRDLGSPCLSVRIVGEDPASADVCTCADRGFLILYTSYTCLESPVRCGKCFCPVPLYMLPKTYDDEYSDICSWASYYQACDTLQMGCVVGERFGFQQMSNLDSDLSVLGIAVCRNIRQVTGIPTYYYLYRYAGKGKRFERARKCPSCGGEWLLDEPMHNLFDFQCKECRLLSNMAFSS